MDLNYLLHRHQVSLIRAEWSPSIEARSAHRQMAGLYSTRIDALQRALGAGIMSPANDDAF